MRGTRLMTMLLIFLAKLMKRMVTINGSWSDSENAWVSEELSLTGNIWLEVELPDKGRMVIKKKVETPAEKPTGTVAMVKWPKALITPWTGPKFRIRFVGDSDGCCVKIYLTDTPKKIEYANI